MPLRDRCGKLNKRKQLGTATGVLVCQSRTRRNLGVEVAQTAPAFARMSAPSIEQRFTAMAGMAFCSLA